KHSARHPPRNPPPAALPRAPTAETTSPALAARAPPRAQPPPTPPQAQAPECATTPRQPQDDGCSAADDQTDARRHQTTPPAPSPRPQAKAASPPHALARRCTPHAPQHQDHQCRSVGRSPPHPPPQPAPPQAPSPPLPPPPPPPTHLQPQTHGTGMINPSLQRQNQISLAQPRRHLQQHRLIEAIEPTPALQKPAHDRRRRQSASGNVRRARRLSDNAGDPGQ